jgi:tetratricopeptide (TPR) repeat protein
MTTPPDAVTPDATPDAPGPGTARTLALRWAPLLILVAAWLTHGSVRSNGWVLDDVRLVRDDVRVARGPGAISGLLSGPWFPSDTASGPYGPLVQASFALEAPLWREDDGALSPGGFHLTNLFLHGLCALLVFAVLLQLLPRRPIVAVAAGLLFAAHPLHAGTVGPLMGRGELLATLFSLLTVLTWRAYGGTRPAWVPLSALCWLLALLAKEVAIGVPLALFVLDRAVPPAGGRAPAGRGLLAYAAFALPLLVFFQSWSGPGAPLLDATAQGAGTGFLVGATGLVRGVLSALVPAGLRGDHSDEMVAGTGYVLGTAATWTLVLVLAVTLLVLVRTARGRAGRLDTLWWLLLALGVPAILLARIGAPIESRFAYLVLLPVFALLGGFVEALARRAGRVEPFTLARGALACLLVVACYAALSRQEARAWRDDTAFHRRLLDRNPQHIAAMIRLSRAQRLTARELRLEATLLPTSDPRHRMLITKRNEAAEKALAWARRAVRHELGRNSTSAWREYGFSQLDTDSSASALRSLERARSLDPVLRAPPAEVAERYPASRVYAAAEVYYAIGKARQAVGQRESSADAFLTAATLDPRRLDYVEHAGMMLCRVNRYAEGLPLLREALRRATSDRDRERIDEAIKEAQTSAKRIADRFFREGHDAENRGDVKQAIGAYERATEVNPLKVEAWISAGWLRGHYLGSYEMAWARFAKAEEILEGGVRRGSISKDDPRFKRIRLLREELARQKAVEDAEEAEEDARYAREHAK